MTPFETKDLLTLDEALAVLPDGESVHTFIGNSMLIGADWPRHLIVVALTESPDIKITGPIAQRMGHGMACRHPRNGGYLYVATKTRTDEATTEKAAVVGSQEHDTE